MMKVLLFFFTCTALFAENLVLDNRTNYPGKSGKMAIQWAETAKQVADENNAIIYGNIDGTTVRPLLQAGRVNLAIPAKAEYFRVVVWTKKGEPDLLTNWVDALPNKVYTLKQDHLFPTVLMAGAGC